MKKIVEDKAQIFQLITYVTLIAALMFITICGAVLYRTVNGNKSTNELTINSLTYMQSQIRSENSDDISIADGPEGDMLILSNNDEGYNILIYCCDGYLCEEISAEKQADAERAEKISKLDEMSLSKENSFIKINLDGKTAVCALKSEGAE